MHAGTNNCVKPVTIPTKPLRITEMSTRRAVVTTLQPHDWADVGDTPHGRLTARAWSSAHG